MTDLRSEANGLRRIGKTLSRKTLAKKPKVSGSPNTAWLHLKDRLAQQSAFVLEQSRKTALNLAGRAQTRLAVFTPTHYGRAITFAFFMASGQTMIVTLWVITYLGAWPLGLRIALPVLWFAALFVLTLYFAERGTLRRARSRDSALKNSSTASNTPAGTAEKNTTAPNQMSLATMTHELRTPLNAILGFSEILDRDFDASGNAKSREYARLIHQSGRHLLSVVNGMLDLSKIEAGCYQLSPEPVCVKSLTETCCKILAPLATKQSLRLTARIAHNIGEVDADARAFRQILLNLLSNALKFTPPDGRVEVIAIRKGEQVMLTVSNTGKGIPPKDFERLCQPFIQGDQSYNRTQEGTGIGLSVVRGLTALHGGVLRLENDDRFGTSLSVTIGMSEKAVARAEQAARTHPNMMTQAA